jgi:hypothetical protein
MVASLLIQVAEQERSMSTSVLHSDVLKCILNLFSYRSLNCLNSIPFGRSPSFSSSCSSNRECWPRVLNKVVDEDGPGAVLVVVGHLVVDRLGKVEQKIPGVLRDRTLVVLLKQK